MQKLIAFLLVFLVVVAGAIGEAQDEIVITATNLTRLGSLGVSTSIEDENDVDFISTEDGSYLAMLVTRVRPAEEGEPCKFPNPPPPPGTPCYITERVLSIYEITTNTYTQICSKSYAGSGLYPSALKWFEHDEEPYVVVLEGLQLGFYGLNCQELYQTQLPVDFTSPYVINAYQNVTDIGKNLVEMMFDVAGGVYDEITNQEKGLVAVVEILNGDTYYHQKILECEGIATNFVSEADGDGNITSFVVCTKEISDETLEDTVIVIKGTLENPFANIAVPNFIAYRHKSFCTRAEIDAQIINSLGDNNQKIEIVYLANNPLNGVCRPELSLLDENGLLHTLSVFSDAPSGVDAIVNSISAVKVLIKRKVPEAKLALTVAGQIGDEAVVEALILEEAQETLLPLRGKRVNIGNPGSYAAHKVVIYRPGRALVVSSISGDAPLTVQQLSSAPIGGPGTNDLVILELEICSSPIAFADLTKIDNGDEEKDTDKGLFKVSFDYVDPYECQPATCIAELVCDGGGSVAVENDQLVEIKVENDECKIENKDGKLEIKGQVKLVASCSNETGSSVAEALPEGLSADNDGQGEEDD